MDKHNRLWELSCLFIQLCSSSLIVFPVFSEIRYHLSVVFPSYLYLKSAKVGARGGEEKMCKLKLSTWAFKFTDDFRVQIWELFPSHLCRIPFILLTCSGLRRVSGELASASSSSETTRPHSKSVGLEAPLVPFDKRLAQMKDLLPTFRTGICLGHLNSICRGVVNPFSS